MKHLTTLLCLILIATLNNLNGANKNIDARDIIRQINENKDVNYDGATISGDLDFTLINGMEQMNKYPGSKNYVGRVKTALTFTNCTFTGNIIACRWEKATKSNYIVHFDDEVTIETCTFKQDVNFQHSDFGKNANFKFTTFMGKVNFQHSKFNRDADFINITTHGYPNWAAHPNKILVR